MADFSNKVVYQIYPKSFRDTNGDGFGDIPGVIEKLDYLQDLGVDYLWLTPFFPSPQHDNGYDVADYRSVDPKFGTMEDLEELIRQGEDRGIGLMLDMVFNHTSTEHAWFQKALAGDERYQKYYIFKDGAPDCPPTNWQSKFGGPAWEYVPSLKKWYLRLYDVTQADLNWDNPRVREELKEILRFWKNKGIKAFRFDVINLVSKPEVMEDDFLGDGRRFYSDGPHIHEYLKELVRDAGIEDFAPLRCHPCRLPANANIVFALPLRLNHFPRKSHSLRRIYARGSSPFLLETFRLSVDTGDRNKLLCILKPRYGALRTIFDN